jgi:NADPH:quinone reductase-like Zn-dependent oxidoreductase
VTLGDVAAVEELGVRIAAGPLRNDVLGEYAQLAAEGRFSVPVARTFPLAEWSKAAELSLSGRARGKLVLRIG